MSRTKGEVESFMDFLDRSVAESPDALEAYEDELSKAYGPEEAAKMRDALIDKVARAAGLPRAVLFGDGPSSPEEIEAAHGFKAHLRKSVGMR